MDAGRGAIAVDAGVGQDFELLLGKFKDTESVRYQEFSKLWVDLKMTYIFAGKINERELREFTEECFLYAMHTFTSSGAAFQHRIGALYLLYALYIKQPMEPKAKIRMTLDQWKGALKFMSQAQEHEHLDAVYIFTKLRCIMAFQYTATPRPMYLKVSNAGGFLANKPPLFHAGGGSESLLMEAVNSENIQQISAIHEQYHRLKCALAGPDATKPDPAFNILREDLVQSITKTIASHEEWKKRKCMGKKSRRDSGVTTSESDPDSDYEPARGTSPKRLRSATGETRAQIRAKAFSGPTTTPPTQDTSGKGGPTKGKGLRGRVRSKCYDSD